MAQLIPMARPDLTTAEIEAVNQVLHTPFLSIGPQLTAFEQAVASYVGVRHAVGVNSGTSGLHLCIIGAGIKEGDLVITMGAGNVNEIANALLERLRRDT